MSLTLVTINGTYANPDGSTPTGSVSFQLVLPNGALEMVNGVDQVNLNAITATLSAGALSVELYATDDSGTEPLGGFYIATVLFDAADPSSASPPPLTQYFKLPHAVTPVDITALTL